MKKILSFPAFPLLIIIFVALGIRLYNLNYNSPFLDEAIYIRLGQEFFNGTLDARNPYSWVGGMPVVYPPISYIAYRIGGVIGSRILNILLGTLAVYLVYVFAKQLRLFHVNNFLNELTGIFSALLFAVATVPIHLSRIAIYDMPSFIIFLLGIVLLQKAIEKKEQSNYYFGAAFALILSFLAKYTVLIFFPLIGVVSFFYTWKYQRNQLEALLVSLTILAGGIVYYLFIHFSDLIQFLSLQVVNRNSISPVEIFLLFMKTTAIWYVLGTIGLIVFFFQRKYQVLTLFLFSLIPLFVHIASRNTATLQQDTNFTLLAIIPVVSGLFSWISTKNIYLTYSLPAVFACFFFLFSTPQRSEFERYWPDTTHVMNFLLSQASPHDKILAEADDVAVIALEKKLPVQNITGSHNFSYQGLQDANAYSKAVHDKYFTFIEFDHTASDFENTLSPLVKNRYEIVYDKEPFTIYKVMFY